MVYFYFIQKNKEGVLNHIKITLLMDNVRYK